MPEPRSSGALSEELTPDEIFQEAPAEVLIDAVLSEPGGAAGEPLSLAKRRVGVGFWLAVGWIALIVALAALAPILPIADPNEVADGPSNGGPSLSNWLGTDPLGRDLLARTIWGARISLVVGFVSVAFGLLVGGTIGMLAGYYRGFFERVVMRMVDVLLAFPAIVLALALVTFIGRDFQNLLLAIGILAIAPIARLARANTLQWAQRDFVLAAHGLGAKSRRILLREVLPNVVLPMAALALLGIAIAIVAEGTLAFLGLSVEDPTATWGKMIYAGKGALEDAPQAAFVPAAAMFLTVLALNLAGDRLRQLVDVRQGAL
jgi:peptide/nickel transport system permease protein